MKKIFLGLFLIFGLAIGFLNLDIKAGEPTYAPVSYTYTINKDGVKETPTTVTDINYGTSVNFDFGTDPEGYTFVGHINQNKLVSTGTNSVSINVTENTEVEYLFKTNGSTAVIFKDTNLDFVSILLADGSGIITGYPNITSYSKPGLTTTDWTDGANTYTQAVLATQAFSLGTTTILYPAYTTTESFTVSTPNGSSSNLTSTSGTYFNDLIEVTPNAPGTGYYFDHWEKDGRIVSYDAIYKFTVADNHKLAAVYDQVEGPSFVGTFVGVSRPYDNLRTGYYSLVGQFDLRTGDSIVEYGFIQSNDVSTPTLATDIENTDTVIVYSNKYNPTTNEFVMSFDKATKPIKTYYRAFATIINGTTVDTIYSDVVTNNKVWFYNSEGWTNISAFTKYAGRESLEINDLGSWPGTLAIQDGTTNWWYVNVPLNPPATPFTVIFNGIKDSNNIQTPDIYLDDNIEVYTKIRGEVYSSKEIAENTTRVWFYNSASWSNVYYHAWYVSGVVDNDANTTWNQENAFAIREGQTNWWFVDLAVNTTQTEIGLIFKNAQYSNSQTHDIFINTSNFVYVKTYNYFTGEPSKLDYVKSDNKTI